MNTIKKFRLMRLYLRIYEVGSKKFLINILKIKIEPAPDEWDRLFNVDFYIKIKDKYIGLQIKPVNQGIQLPEIYKEKSIQEETHKKFTEVFGGKVFYIYSTTINGKKEIVNREIIEEIKKEVERLKKLEQQK